MTREASSAWSDLGPTPGRRPYAQPTARYPQPPRPQPRPRPVPTIDPEIANGHHPNDFDLWFAEQQKKKQP